VYSFTGTEQAGGLPVQFYSKIEEAGQRRGCSRAEQRGVRAEQSKAEGFKSRAEESRAKQRAALHLFSGCKFAYKIE
jgi:hypothetical protein